MKKTLFAMLALATMLPAMGANWKISETWVNSYEDILTPSNYTLYLMEKDGSTLSDVKTELEGKTFTEFTTTIASGDGIEFYRHTDAYLIASGAVTPFPVPDVRNPKGNIWGVCVYKNENEDDVLFQVLEVGKTELNMITFSKPSSGTPYTSFKADSPVVPEPATATLSLLALAGLATRRKRK